LVAPGAAHQASFSGKSTYDAPPTGRGTPASTERGD
jgi:hypothetical protein